MGFDFKGLTSGALVSKNNASSTRNAKDVGDVPAAVAGHTSTEGSHPDEKQLGGLRSDSEKYDSDEELNRVDTHAEHGVQRAQAMTHVWTKKDLIIAYIL
jgi:hypothetical protein